MLISLFRLLAVFALSLQMATPSLAAAGSEAAFDVSRFICVTPGSAPSDSKAQMAERLAEALSTENKTPDDRGEHCSLCVLASAAVLPVVVLPTQAASELLQPAAIRFEAGFVSAPRGPPVGATGPPSFQLI